MSKHFQFIFNETQKEGDTIYQDIEFPYAKTVQNAVAFETSTRWDNIVLEFAKFLDNVGYVRVHERISELLDGYWGPVYKFTEEDVTDEDSSDTGCAGKAGCTD